MCQWCSRLSILTWRFIRKLIQELEPYVFSLIESTWYSPRILHQFRELGSKKIWDLFFGAMCFLGMSYTFMSWLNYFMQDSFYWNRLISFSHDLGRWIKFGRWRVDGQDVLICVSNWGKGKHDEICEWVRRLRDKIGGYLPL